MKPKTVPDSNTLRITRVEVREDQLVCVLSDGRTLAVPISISPILRDAPIEARYNWRLAGGGEA
ncbi:MAG: DUF2442 domain-containing protein, partial [Gemmatimonadales bacterium]